MPTSICAGMAVVEQWKYWRGGQGQGSRGWQLACAGCTISNEDSLPYLQDIVATMAGVKYPWP